MTGRIDISEVDEILAELSKPPRTPLENRAIDKLLDTRLRLTLPAMTDPFDA